MQPGQESAPGAPTTTEPTTTPTGGTGAQPPTGPVVTPAIMPTLRPAAPGAPTTDPAPADPAPTRTPLSELPADWQKEIKALRDKDATNRVEARDLRAAQEAAEAAKASEAEALKKASEAEQLRATVAKALGLEADTPPTVEELTAKLATGERSNAQLKAENRAMSIRLDIWTVAEALGAKASALDDSVAFRDAVKKLDPTAGDYKAKLAELIGDTVDSNPARFQVGAAPTSTPAAPGQVPGTTAPSGGEFAGGSGTASPDAPSFEQLRANERKRLTL